MTHKKDAPPFNAFIPMPNRIVAIVQLCFAFTLLAWGIIQPYMSHYFTYHSQLALYKTVMGHSDLLIKQDPAKASAEKGKLDRHALRFQTLPAPVRSSIEQGYLQLDKQNNQPFTQKVKESFIALVEKLHLFAKGWSIFSIIIALMLLLRVEGAAEAAWLLPLLATLYAIDNQWHSTVAATTADTALFPTEQTLITEYLDSPLNGTLSQQREQLLKGWHLYLIRKWANEEPSQKANALAGQIEKGEFSFNVARLQQLQNKEEQRPATLFYKEPLPWLIFYISWNLFFAWFVNRKTLPKTLFHMRL